MTEWHPLRSSTQVGSAAWQSLNELAEKRAKEAPSAIMPSLDHVTMKDFEQVYEPAEDTYLLIDGIQLDVSTSENLKSTIYQALEIGCGSGVPIVYLGTLLKQDEKETAICYATDINPIALRTAQKTASENGLKRFEAIQCDLGSAILPHHEGKMDVVIFNPPYVPTPDEEVSGNGIEASWAGGTNGRIVVDRAIPQIAQLLSRPHGVCYLITVDDNEPEKMAEIFWKLGLAMEPFVRRRACNEYLTVQKLTWRKNESEWLPLKS
jgi:release factor glutamine methyltransferase